VKWTPSKMIARLGKEINNPESVYYWAQKNHIPVFSPALTDGSLGDMIFFHSYKNPGLVLDIVEGARPDEAVSWGKIRVDAQPVKVYADASLVFPLLVAETFAQKMDAFMHEKNED
ncbi:DHPS isoform 20, partial [Pan troglodytes]